MPTAEAAMPCCMEYVNFRERRPSVMIRITNSCPTTVTNVSNIFIDRYMPSANGEFVKVYLCLLRQLQSGNSQLSVSSMADLLCHTENDILRALKYWEREGLLTMVSDDSGNLNELRLCQPKLETTRAEVTPEVSLLPPTSGQPSVKAAEVPLPAEPSKPALPQKKTYTADDLQTFRKDPEIQELFFIIQTYMKRQLGSTDIDTILYWYDSLGFPVDLIDYLVQYCISKGHTSTRYMDKVALAWAEKGIHTIEEARENAAIHNQLYYAVMKALGIHGRNLVPAENDMLSRWSGEYGMSEELILEACARTIAATHQPSFEYTDSILSHWKQEQVKNLADVKKLDELHAQKKKTTARPASADNRSRNKFNNFNQRNYEEEALEKMLLNSSL